MKRILFSLLALLGLTAFSCDKEPVPEPLPDFFEVCLFRPGDYGSANWRIPALRCLDDGTLLAFTDKRKYNQSDLPEDIDIVLRRSLDGGLTWTEPSTLAQGTGYKQGFGDCAVVQCQDGTVVAAYVGGNGFWSSSPTDPLSSYIQRSTDRGLTWEERRNVTSSIWDGTQYRGAFFGSGNGLLLTRGPHAGRILFVTAMVRSGENVPDNFAVYSDDNGLTWQLSSRAYAGGDEAKVVQLADGSILMSVRQSGARGYTRSTDGGATWQPQGRWATLRSNACNGDMLYIGDSILLHSLPNSMQREKVSIFISRDQGNTWSFLKELSPYPSCYSSLTRLTDGRIAAYLEEDRDGDGNYELYYQCFTLDWLMRE